MRAVYFTDLHLYDRDISSRNDRSSLAALDKLGQVAVYGAHHDLVISGGDLFGDRVDSSEYEAAVITVLKMVWHFKTLIGNHDIVHRETENYKRRNLAVLEASGACSILRSDELVENGILGLSAFDDGIIAEVEAAGMNSRVNAIFAHHFIGHGRDRLVLDVKALKAQYVNLKYIFSGHDHAEYPDMLIEGVHVIRPGGALRTSTAFENVRRIPQFLDIQADSSWDNVQILRVPFQCQAGEDVFNLDLKAMDKSAEAQLDDFTASIGSAAPGPAVALDLEAVVLEMAQASGDQDVIEYVQNDLHSLLTS